MKRRFFLKKKSRFGSSLNKGIRNQSKGVLSLVLCSISILCCADESQGSIQTCEPGDTKRCLCEGVDFQQVCSSNAQWSDCPCMMDKLTGAAPSVVSPSSQPIQSGQPTQPEQPIQVDVPQPLNLESQDIDDWLHIEGNKIVDLVGNSVWLTGVNWFGFNCSEQILHGLWSANLEQTLRAIAERGFNILRIPISTELAATWMQGEEKPPGGGFTWINPELEGLTTLEIFDHLIVQAEQLGIKIMIDQHSPDANNSGHVYPLWHKDSITTEIFMQTWEWLAKRYKDNDTVIAFDLENEPHGNPSQEPDGAARWDDSPDLDLNWKAVAEQVSARILAIHPHILILIEGIEAYPKPGKDYSSRDPDDYLYTWWGANLRGAAEHPIAVPEQSDQIMYSPHDYGPAVFLQPWFKGDFSMETLNQDCWYQNWFYLYDTGLSPLLIGEWGGFLDGGKNQQWMEALRAFIIKHRLHHTFWCFNANSGDTGGLIQNDFVTWDEAKYEFVKPSLWTDSNGKFVGLDHQQPLGSNETGTTVKDYYREENPAP